MSRVGKRIKGIAQELFRLGENDVVSVTGGDVVGTNGYGSSVREEGLQNSKATAGILQKAKGILLPLEVCWALQGLRRFH